MGKRRRKISSGSPWSPRLVISGGEIISPRSKEVIIRKGDALCRSQIERCEEVIKKVAEERRALEEQGRYSYFPSLYHFMLLSLDVQSLNRCLWIAAGRIVAPPTLYELAKLEVSPEELTHYRDVEEAKSNKAKSGELLYFIIERLSKIDLSFNV